MYKILITHHTSLYIFCQNLESLSKSPLRRSNRHDLVHNSTYFPSFLELSDSLYRYKLRGMCGCLLVHVLNTYMTSCQQAKHPRQPKNKQEPTEETSSTTASSMFKVLASLTKFHRDMQITQHILARVRTTWAQHIHYMTSCYPIDQSQSWLLLLLVLLI